MTGKRLLLHMCCGPCSITVIKTLQDMGCDVTGFFYNPNIHPTTEYMKRRDGALEVGEKLGVKIILKDNEYDPQVYFRAITFREANRCFQCYAMRLERTASIAKRGKFDFYTTTLLYSKFQRHEMIRKLGEDMTGPESKTRFHYADFREGWKEGIETSKSWEIYRQQYCGCLYSEYERYQQDLEK
ncbi:MAG: epoxyqueuosine reductase QueH [Desulfovibrio sp.]